MRKNLILLLFFPIIVFGFGTGTTKKIDTIENNTEANITLSPSSSVIVDTFTGNFVLQSSGSKEIEESATTNLELSYLSGVTSALQTQIDGKEDTLPLTTQGDLLYHNGANLARLAVGTPGQALIVNAGSVGTWQDIPDTSPTALQGDIIYNNGAGDVALNIGSTNQLLTVIAGNPSWQDAPVSTTLTTKGDLQGYSTANARVAVGTDGQVLSADSVEATGVKWIDLPPSSPSFTTVTKTTTATLAITGEDNVLVDATAGDFTVTLPAASGNNGLTYKITKSTMAGIVTLDANASETIGGKLSIKLATKDDSVIITTDGSSWFYLSDDVSYSSRYTTDAGQSISNNTLTTVIYEDIGHDKQGMCNTSGVCTITIDGTYSIKGLIAWSTFGISNGAYSRIDIYKNSALKTSKYRSFLSSGNILFSHQVSDTLELVIGDTIEIKLTQNLGVAETLVSNTSYNVFTVERIK